MSAEACVVPSVSPGFTKYNLCAGSSIRSFRSGTNCDKGRQLRSF